MTTLFILAVIQLCLGILLGWLLHMYVHECKDSPQLQAWKQARNIDPDQTYVMDRDYWQEIREGYYP